MGFHAHHFVGVLGVVAVCAAVSPALAQSTAPVGNQSILFSAPAGNGLEIPGAPSGSPASRRTAGSQIQAPHSVFGPFGPDAPDNSMPTFPVPSPVNALQQMMKERQQNWTEMTPAEILGVPGLDKKPDSAKSAADLTEAYHSPLEKFLLQQRLAQTGTTNLNVANAGWNFLDRGTGLPNPQQLERMRNGATVRSQIFDRWLENAQSNGNDQRQDSDDDWARVFLAPQPEQPTAAQTADMAAFRQLLEPIAAAQELKSQSGFRSFSPAMPAADPNIEPQPAGYNPVGASFIPLQSGIGRPARLAPLPALTSSLPAPTVTPSWAPQPPPWTLTTPQLYVNQLRKF